MWTSQNDPINFIKQIPKINIVGKYAKNLIRWYIYPERSSTKYIKYHGRWWIANLFYVFIPWSPNFSLPMKGDKWKRQWCRHPSLHWGLNKTANILLTRFRDAFSWIKCLNFNKISIKCVLKGLIYTKLVLVPAMAWCQMTDIYTKVHEMFSTDVTLQGLALLMLS